METQTQAGWTIAAVLIGRVIFAGVFLMAVSFKFMGMQSTASYIATAGFPVPLILAWCAAMLEAALAPSRKNRLPGGPRSMRRSFAPAAAGYHTVTRTPALWAASRKGALPTITLRCRSPTGRAPTGDLAKAGLENTARAAMNRTVPVHRIVSAAVFCIARR